MINGMILILILLIFRSLMEMSLDVPLIVYIYLNFFRFARASSHVTDFINRNKFLTAKLFKQGDRYHKLRKAFSKFYRRHFELIEKYNVSLKKLMQQGICNPEFYGDLVYKFKKIIGNPNFPHFIGYQNFINDTTKLVSSQTLAHVQLRVCLKY